MAVTLGRLAVPVDCPHCPQPYNVHVDIALDRTSDDGRMAVGDIHVDHDDLHAAVRAHLAQHR